MFPASIALCLFPPIGVVLSYIAVFANAEGLGNPGLFFLPYSLTLIVVRMLAGRLSDRYGRLTVLLPAVLAFIAALIVIASAHHVVVLLLGSLLLGCGFGIAHPTLLAMAVDRAPEGRQGASMSTLIGAFDLASAAAPRSPDWPSSSWGCAASSCSPRSRRCWPRCC